MARYDSNQNNIIAKVRNGTRSDEKRLCDTCAYSHIMKGAADSKEVIYCQKTGHYIKFRVVDCNQYYSKNATSLGSFYEIAWVLQSDKKKGKLGFLTPQEFKQQERKNSPIIPDFDD